MFLGKLKKHSKIIWAWYETERDNEFPSKRVMFSLHWYAKHNCYPDYGYTGTWKAVMEYTCDRMNGGRAKALLRLIRKAKKEKAKKEKV
jgi:hypothetical protein